MEYIRTLDWLCLDLCGLVSYASTIFTNCLGWFCLTRSKVNEEIEISKDGNISVNLSRYAPSGFAP